MTSSLRSTAVRHRPLAKLPQAVASCSQAGAAYGKCIGAKYQEVEPGMCQAEFTAFKECVSKAVSFFSSPFTTSELPRLRQPSNCSQMKKAK
ncbi:hypothetical protein JCM5350_006761 [Sporobolomyces pararoseus]